MIRILSIDNCQGLPQIDELIHDCFFDLEKVTYDSALHTLTIPFRGSALEHKGAFVTHALGSGPEYLLVISNVVSVDMRDDAHVRYYDFNRLELSNNGSEIFVLTGVPLLLKVAISDLKAEILRTERMIEYR